MKRKVAESLRRLCIWILLSICSQSALAGKPELVTDKNARWEFKQATNAKGITSMWIQTIMQGSGFSVFYDGRFAKLNFGYKDQDWISHIGEITVDGVMLAAYEACYEENATLCAKRQNMFEFALDNESIKQLENGNELRTTLKFDDSSLRTFVVPLAESSSALNQLQAAWKKAETTELMFALLHRDITEVKKLIASGQNVNAIDRAGRTPLSIVLPGQYYHDDITDKDKTLIRILVENGANINHVRREPILYEHLSGNASLEFIRFLLELGADPNIRNRKGEPVITTIASRKDAKEIYQLLLKAGGNKFATDSSGRNLLHNVAMSSGPSQKSVVAGKFIEFLLDEGFDIESKDAEGWTPICYAAIASNMDMAKILVQKGANNNPTGKDGKKIQDVLKDSLSKAENKNSQKVSRYENMLYVLKNAGATTVAFKNKTNARVQVAIRYKNLDNEWVTDSWYNVEPGKTRRVISTNNSVFYYFAITPDGKWGGTDKYYRVQGMDQKQGFRKKTLSKKYRGDTYTISLTE